MARRAGSDEAARLFQSIAEGPWRECGGRYGEAVALKASVAPKTTTQGLAALDAWWRGDLPGLVHEQKCLSAAQLCKAVEWKLKRGKLHGILWDEEVFGERILSALTLRPLSPC
jgi:hypothetical protein